MMNVAQNTYVPEAGRTSPVVADVWDSTFGGGFTDKPGESSVIRVAGRFHRWFRGIPTTTDIWYCYSDQAKPTVWSTPQLCNVSGYSPYLVTDSATGKRYLFLGDEGVSPTASRNIYIYELTNLASPTDFTIRNGGNPVFTGVNNQRKMTFTVANMGGLIHDGRFHCLIAGRAGAAPNNGRWDAFYCTGLVSDLVTDSLDMNVEEPAVGVLSNFSRVVLAVSEKYGALIGLYCDNFSGSLQETDQGQQLTAVAASLDSDLNNPTSWRILGSFTPEDAAKSDILDPYLCWTGDSTYPLMIFGFGYINYFAPTMGLRIRNADELYEAVSEHPYSHQADSLGYLQYRRGPAEYKKIAHLHEQSCFTNEFACLQYGRESSTHNFGIDETRFIQFNFDASDANADNHFAAVYTSEMQDGVTHYPLKFFPTTHFVGNAFFDLLKVQGAGSGIQIYDRNTNALRWSLESNNDVFSIYSFVAGSNVLSISSSGVTFGNTGLRVQDTNASHSLTFKPGSDLSANRTFTLTTGDADRTLTLSANVTLDQSVATSSSPAFTAVTLGNTGLLVKDTDASHTLALVPGSNLSANRTLTITTGDSNRTLTLGADVTLDQDVATSSSPAFAAVSLGSNASGALYSLSGFYPNASYVEFAFGQSSTLMMGMEWESSTQKGKILTGGGNSYPIEICGATCSLSPAGSNNNVVSAGFDGGVKTLGLYGATRVAKYSTTGTTTGFTAGSGTAVKDDSTFTGNTGSTAYTMGDIVRALKLLGAIAA